MGGKQLEGTRGRSRGAEEEECHDLLFLCYHDSTLDSILSNEIKVPTAPFLFTTE